MAIEVIIRREYQEPKYLTRCCRCLSVLRFLESDTVYNDEYRPPNYYLECSVCGFNNPLGLKSDWAIETERLKGELYGD